MEVLIDWVKGILGCLLIMSLVLQGISGKAYSPYLRLFMGILLILTVLSPITDPTGISDTLEGWMDKLAFQEDQDLTDKLLKGEEWIEGQIVEKAEEFADKASQSPEDELEVSGTEVPENEGETGGLKQPDESTGEESHPMDDVGIEIEVEVEIDPVDPVVPVGGTGGE